MTAVTALVAVIAGPAAVYYVARMQINANAEAMRQQVQAGFETAKIRIQASVVSANRQKWIDELRDEIATLDAAGTERVDARGTLVDRTPFSPHLIDHRVGRRVVLEQSTLNGHGLVPYPPTLSQASGLGSGPREAMRGCLVLASAFQSGCRAARLRNKSRIGTSSYGSSSRRRFSMKRR